MTLAELKRILQGAVVGNVLPLSGSLVGSPTITQLFSAYYGGDLVNIGSPTIQVSGSQLTITGQATLYGLSASAVALQFSIDGDGNPQLTFPYDLPSNWSLSQSFPELDGPQYAALRILGGQLTLNSGGQTPGLTFSGKADVSRCLGVLGAFIQASLVNVDLTGPFTSIHPTLIDWQASLPDVTIGPISLTGNALAFVSQAPPFWSGDPNNTPPDYGPNAVYADVCLRGTLTLGDSTALQLEADLPILSDALRLGVTFSDNGLALPSLGDLAGLIGGANLTAMLPPEIQNLGSQLAIMEVEAWLGTQPPSLQSVSLCIASAADFNLFQGLFPASLLQLNGLDFNWSLDDPFGSPSLDWSVGAELVVSQDIAIPFEVQQNDGELLLMAGLAPDSAIDFGDLTAAFFPDVDFSLGFSVSQINLLARPTAKAFTFGAVGTLDLDDFPIDLALELDVSRQTDNSYNTLVSGTLDFGPGTFLAAFDVAAGSKTFIADFYQPDGISVSIADLVKAIMGDQGISSELNFELTEALFAYYQPKGAATGVKLFALDIGAGIDLGGLGNLPLVGQLMPPNLNLKLTGQLLVASAALDETAIAALGALRPSGELALPTSIPQGAQVAVSFRLGDVKQTVDLPVTGDDKSKLPSQQNTNGPAPSVSSGAAKWFNLQKAIGPLQFNRVGFQLDSPNLTVLLDAALSAAGLTIALEGLALTVPLTALTGGEFSLEFGLQGLGIDYRSGPLEIGGSFLKLESNGNVEFAGLAVLRAKALSLAAIGAYGQVDGQPSMFIYAVLSYPLGGPPFFFVTGIAGGFGYNRALTTPTIDQVASFPFVAEAVKPGGPGGLPTSQTARSAALGAQLQAITGYVQQEVGEYFLALGIKFTSFKILDSFALLLAKFGTRFEIDVLGLSNLLVPPNAPASPLAQIQLALRAAFIPDEGFLGIQAQLTPNSFILSRACHLTGGFAFFTWFAGPNNGDFVLTLGGYHPAFKVPSNYPSVPRLGFNWQVDSKLNLKGGAYFALCPHALMAGGFLEANYQSGSLRAWFKAGADFLILWKPFHYDISIYVDLGASYTFSFFGRHTISVSIGADVHIWGPDFAGTATLKIWIFKVKVSFGASGANSLQPIDWSEFNSGFLPPSPGNGLPQPVCTLALTSGLIREISEGDSERWIINPKELSLAANSVIPIKTAAQGSASGTPIDTGQAATDTFGVWPMALTNDQVRTQLVIEIQRDDESVEEDFQFTPVLKDAPAGLWGQPKASGQLQAPPLNPEDRLVASTLAGFAIVPANHPAPNHTSQLSVANLEQGTPQTQGTANQTGVQVDSRLTDASDWSQAQNAILASAVVSNRSALLSDLGFSQAPVNFNRPITEDVWIVNA